MPLQTADSILRYRLNQHGLGGLVAAGALCRQSELLYPEMFHAVSLRQHVLHIELEQSRLLSFKQIEGKLLEDLNLFAERRRLPVVRRFKLTIPQ